jgi:formamidopyrimidine-DNA glycosylase
MLDDDECSNIIKYTKEVLEKAIEAGGTTIRSYSSVDGVSGLFQHKLFVHCRAGDKCSKCSSVIEKIKIGGRGTYYCPNCQKFD